MSSMQNEVQEDTEMRQSKRAENSQNENVIRKQNLFDGSSQSNNRDSSNVSATQRGGYINLSQHACNEGPEDMSRTRIAGDDQEIANGTQRGTKEVTRKPLMSTATPPQWTDEQLNELFADDEDDASLF
ncbi:uncharacterized protein LOC125189305 [Salvia hispanica]|uniref:uncharacterized protein LOC125189305 n=1 Tax=Salvia hispanica TaxID=49212 RepID=UPI002008FD04|nr:uncharacterized protein LOC125189305 [Salvia hispanica]